MRTFGRGRWGGRRRMSVAAMVVVRRGFPPPPFFGTVIRVSATVIARLVPSSSSRRARCAVIASRTSTLISRTTTDWRRSAARCRLSAHPCPTITIRARTPRTVSYSPAVIGSRVVSDSATTVLVTSVEAPSPLRSVLPLSSIFGIGRIFPPAISPVIEIGFAV